MPNGFEKVMAIVRRTGDRCVVLDASGNPEFIILSLDEYERLTGRRNLPSGSETEQLLDSIAQSAGNRPGSKAAAPGAWAAEPSLPPVDPAPESASDQYFFEPIE